MAAPLLYGITESASLSGAALAAKVEAALVGGCGWIQYRDKSDDHSRRRREALLLVRLCNTYGARLIVNDDVELAAAVEAHGVHLGQEDMAPESARRILGSKAIVGVTCHDSLELARPACASGASYVAFGRFFSSGTKPEAGAASLDVLTRARRELDLPIVAIGGIDLDNASSVLAAGADTLAVCGGLFACGDPRARAEAFLRLRAD